MDQGSLGFQITLDTSDLGFQIRQVFNKRVHVGRLGVARTTGTWIGTQDTRRQTSSAVWMNAIASNLHANISPRITPLPFLLTCLFMVASKASDWRPRSFHGGMHPCHGVRLIGW